ncbi:hypothetical protein AK812_SmicGene19866 [Symbiodinium microadriaticum]|uniref:Uncharacterized protein n=1 Tax=Symbiodinium microadriaticum TaxID=2951 RepID=A0A1Q9DRF7_SYMMI|nr:hypothetical protein AK812_SmicGene19866 [Symbiodinium microadriaticum]
MVTEELFCREFYREEGSAQRRERRSMHTEDKHSHHVRDEERKMLEDAERRKEAAERQRFAAEEALAAAVRRAAPLMASWCCCITSLRSNLQAVFISRRFMAARFCPLLEQDIFKLRQLIAERKEQYKAGCKRFRRGGNFSTEKEHDQWAVRRFGEERDRMRLEARRIEQLEGRLERDHERREAASMASEDMSSAALREALRLAAEIKGFAAADAESFVWREMCREAAETRQMASEDQHSSLLRLSDSKPVPRFDQQAARTAAPDLSVLAKMVVPGRSQKPEDQYGGFRPRGTRTLDPWDPSDVSESVAKGDRLVKTKEAKTCGSLMCLQLWEGNSRFRGSSGVGSIAAGHREASLPAQAASSRERKILAGAKAQLHESVVGSRVRPKLQWYTFDVFGDLDCGLQAVSQDALKLELAFNLSCSNGVLASFSAWLPNEDSHFVRFKVRLWQSPSASAWPPAGYRQLAAEISAATDLVSIATAYGVCGQKGKSVTACLFDLQSRLELWRLQGPLNLTETKLLDSGEYSQAMGACECMELKPHGPVGTGKASMASVHSQRALGPVNESIPVLLAREGEARKKLTLPIESRSRPEESVHVGKVMQSLTPAHEVNMSPGRTPFAVQAAGEVFILSESSCESRRHVLEEVSLKLRQLRAKWPRASPGPRLGREKCEAIRAGSTAGSTRLPSSRSSPTATR